MISRAENFLIFLLNVTSLKMAVIVPVAIILYFVSSSTPVFSNMLVCHPPKFQHLCVGNDQFQHSVRMIYCLTFAEEQSQHLLSMKVDNLISFHQMINTNR